MISDTLRYQIHAGVDNLLQLIEQAAQESAGNIGAMLPKDAAQKLGYKSAVSIHRLVAEGKLVKVNGLITVQSISDFLGTTPRARRRVAR